MKTIKIILIIICILTVGFFSTGFIVKEVTYQNDITIERPTDYVFQKLTKVENFKDWMPEVQSVGTRTETTEKIGSIYELEVVTNGTPITVVQNVVDYKPNEVFKVYFKANDMDKINEFVLSQEHGKTKLTLNSTCSSDSYALACIIPYFKSVFQSQDKTSLVSLKNYLEKN